MRRLDAILNKDPKTYANPVQFKKKKVVHKETRQQRKLDTVKDVAAEDFEAQREEEEAAVEELAQRELDAFLAFDGYEVEEYDDDEDYSDYFAEYEQQ